MRTGLSDVHLLVPCRQERGPNGEPITSIFFSLDFVEQERAKALCVSCPMRAPCLQRSLEIHAEGIWGGYDDIERRFYVRLFGERVNGAVRDLPPGIVRALKANKVMRTGPDVVFDEAMEA